MTKLVSRLSEKENVDGPYSLVMDPKRLSEKENFNGPYSLVMGPRGVDLYYKSKNSAKPLLYFSLSKRFSIFQNGPLEFVTLKNDPETVEGFAFDITLEYQAANTSLGRNLVLGRPKYNSTLSFLRLGIDGNVKIYTYYEKVDWGAWEVTFSLFDRDSTWENECQLPDRCGNFGLCEDNQCVACPLANGLMGWSKNCQPEKLSSCRESNFHYYKVEGVDHFLSKYTRGVAVKESDCRKNCSKDCKCLGYFYNQQTSRCWIAYELKTLKKVAKSTHVGYIKAPNH
ncbi:hypothetical protein FEM48_Zijuj12G0113300 [Ziziphus jujuba var. spinosa]|uniref:Apple domain-containing protein n=1 Tax=Ziziphus jujuba var. spinosa TaxID=714518 RepID=A0A978UD06_ZIZJJ|nr:hypothetical protein FEM48_Zijuj12G0113300 [Ziziphus jujuba var. spinosa]